LNWPTATDNNNVKEVKEIDIYPNPSTDLVSINTDLSIKSIKAINSLGREIAIIPIHHKSALQNLEMTFLPSGIYFFQYLDKLQILGVSKFTKL
jgi:hypothetical protein